MQACARCGGRAVFTRRYSGESLCLGCFRESIVEKTRKTVSKYRMFSPGERIAVAVSGGKDSLSLLKVLSVLCPPQRNRIVAVSVDEGVAGYRDEALEHAQRLAHDLGVEHTTVSYKEMFGFSLDEALDWKEERDVASCSFCGVFRRRAIDEAAVRVKASVVATAHNLDDYVQTFLMNLMHGDVARLGWLDPSYADESFPVRRVKPFMELYEEEVALFAYQEGIPFQSVSCPYMHEGLRSEVRDYLNAMEAGHPGMKNVLLRSSLDVISHYAHSTDREMTPCSSCGKPSSNGLCNVCRMKADVEEHVKSRA
ncbi:MAG: TIGR00269 family protein [Nitrososphaerota archaeon]|nr:TIGR00269 family protein [Nitrososphaerota archaeon]MDG7024575.1 TIGR00269 family protein [Nitrososphaerota archaeon]